MKRMLMCPPSYFTVRDVKNPFMARAQAVDRQRAVQQWDALRRAFERAGVETMLIEPVEDLEDMVFAANQSFAGHGRVHENFVVPSRMRYPSREREVPYYTAWFENQGFDVIDLDLDEGAGEYLEGHGDLVYQGESNRVWGGYGFRSSLPAVSRFAEAMTLEGLEVTPLELADETYYHLDTCFAALNERAAIYYPGAFTSEAIERLREGCARLYEVSEADAARFTCNGTAVNGYFIASHVPSYLEKPLFDEGLEPLVVDTSEFEKAGGSVFCLKCVIE